MMQPLPDPDAVEHDDSRRQATHHPPRTTGPFEYRPWSIIGMSRRSDRTRRLRCNNGPPSGWTCRERFRLSTKICSCIRYRLSFPSTTGPVFPWTTQFLETITSSPSDHAFIPGAAGIQQHIVVEGYAIPEGDLRRVPQHQATSVDHPMTGLLEHPPVKQSSGKNIPRPR